ncbi:MAG: hypothetical protein AB7O74_04375 [Candidatus Nanopelagicales bacterium]
MRRHDLDWVSLIAGALFSLIAIGYLVLAATDLSFDGRLVWPLLLIGLGGAGVATAVRATRREEAAYPLPQTDEQG